MPAHPPAADRPVPAWRELVDAFLSAFANASGGSPPTLDPGTALVAWLHVDEWTPWRAQAATILAPDERARAGRKRDARDTDALVLAYALHRLLLSPLMRCEPIAVPIRRDGRGCPRLPDDALYTSLSHAAGRVAIAVCREGPVGIDIEPALNTRHMEEIIERLVHGNERGQLRELTQPRRDQALLDLWVRKESVLKAAGIGLAHGMETFEAPPDEPLALPAGPHSGERVMVSMIDAGSDWAMAVTRPVGIKLQILPIPRTPPPGAAADRNDA